MKSISLALVAFFLTIASFAQDVTVKIQNKTGGNPIYFIDGVKVSKSEVDKYPPSQIASINVVKGQKAIALLGEEGKDGVVYIVTRKTSIKRNPKLNSEKPVKL